MRRGQSLVVWAISEGRKAAAAVNEYLAAKRRTQAPAAPPARSQPPARLPAQLHPKQMGCSS